MTNVFIQIWSFFLAAHAKAQASQAAKGLAAIWLMDYGLRGSLSGHQAFDRDLHVPIAYDYVDMQLRLIQQIRQEQQNEYVQLHSFIFTDNISMPPVVKPLTVHQSCHGQGCYHSTSL